MEILKASVADAPEILKLQKIAYLPEAEINGDYNIPPLTQTLEELEEEFKYKSIIKVVENGVLIGSGQAYCQSGTCFIGRMSVEPEYQGKGIGSRILKTLESTFAEAKRIELFTGANSEANLALYKRRGYKAYKTEKLGKATIVFLEKFVG